MKKLYSTLFLMALLCVFGAKAQDIVTTSPSPLQEGSENVVITFHADLGNQGLMGLGSTAEVYAHTGVITNLSNGSWKYAPTWLDNAAKYKLKYVSANTWELNIGDIRTYYGIKNANETVEKLAFVFRNANGSREGKTATGGDIFVDVYPDGFQLEFGSNSGFVLNSQNSTVTFTARTTSAANIDIYVNDEKIASAAKATELSKEYTFAQGDYTAKAVATSGDMEMSKELSICYPGDSPKADYPGKIKMGAVAQSNGDVIFCIAAPEKTNAMIVGSWNDYKPLAKNIMNYTEVDGLRYFWIKVSGLDSKTDYPYYYLIDESIKVGDPYARLVLDPYNDKWLSDGTYPGLIPYPTDKVEGNVMLAVYNGARDDYDWQAPYFQRPDQDDLIIYELLVRDFTGTEGKANGNGTIKQAMEKLDYLQSLNVNAIELMPIQEFNGNNSWGYNTNFYFAPDKAYGTPNDYRDFIDECHKRGISVILDVVFNQSDGLHPWYQMYPAGSNPFYNERAPHAYSVLNDWNQDNLLVQQQWEDMIRYWMSAYKVDGFRFDLVKGLGDNESYGGNASESNTNKYNASRVERMKRLTEVVHSMLPGGYSINENLAGSKEENEMAANGQLNWANVNEASCQFAMGYTSDSNCNRFYAPSDQRTWGSTVSYAESHDEQRMGYKQDQWGVSGVKGNLDASMVRLGSVAAQMLLCPGAHMIWQFGELGNATNTKNSDGGNNTDPKPVYWSYLDVPQRHGLYQNYCDLAGMRAVNKDLFDENADFSIKCGANDWANGRFIYASNDSKELICVINPNTADKTFSGVQFKTADNAAYSIFTESYEGNATFDATAGTVTLKGGAYVVIVNEAVAGIDDAMINTLPTAIVRGGHGQIVINGAYSTAEAYNLSGQKMPSLNVRPGLYIVVVDGKAYKVAVR